MLSKEKIIREEKEKKYHIYVIKQEKEFFSAERHYL